MSVTPKQLANLVTRRQWWNQPIAGGYNLNCSAPWDEANPDPQVGEICSLTIEAGELVWRWEWNAYDECYRFPTTREFARFYTTLLDDGIDGVGDYDEYRVETNA